jgi:hypothetical protein
MKVAIRFYAGTQHGVAGRNASAPCLSREQVLEKYLRIINAEFPEGATAYKSLGFWRNSKSRMVREHSFVFEVLMDTQKETIESKTRIVALKLKAAGWQDSILVTITDLDFAFL